MRIHVHLGVHKTATTFIQAVLEKNRRNLNAAGIGYIPLRAFRKGIGDRLQELPAGTAIGDVLDRFFEGPPPAEIRGLLVSEENLLGNNVATVHTGVLYPQAEARLARFREMLRGHDVTAFLCIRSYEAYIASQYCEALRWGGFVRFEIFRRRMRFETFRWPMLYTRINNALQPRQVRMWRYEDFRQNAETILRALAFDYDGPLDMDHEDVRLSMSHAAVERLHDIERRMGATVATSQVRQVEAELPKTSDRPAFDPWQEDERAELRAIYDADCVGAPDAWLISPGAGTARRMTPAGVG